MSGVMSDVTDRKLADQRRQLLINELNHRVKNTLAIVQGIAAQTFRGRADEQARIFQGRLLALSTAHNVLTRENWESAGLQEIVADAVRPFHDPGGGQRIDAKGEDVRLAPKTAVALAMALHELGANAVKYGALSAPEGRVDLSWTCRDDRLRLTWRESGGPPVAPPERQGFGARMLQRGLAAELGGKVSIDFEPSGVVCSVDAPLPQASESHA
jgi:two-component sensor histidine kinase